MALSLREEIYVAASQPLVGYPYAGVFSFTEPLTKGVYAGSPGFEAYLSGAWRPADQQVVLTSGNLVCDWWGYTIIEGTPWRLNATIPGLPEAGLLHIPQSGNFGPPGSFVTGPTPHEEM